MIQPKDVTIIIPHLGADEQQERSLDLCIDSLWEWPGKLIIAHNGISDCKHPSMVEVAEQGQCKAVNAAVATTDTPWILVTNDDMIYPPGWFERLAAHMRSDTACVSPRLVEPRPGAPTFLVEFCGGAGGDFDKQKFLSFVEKYNAENDAILGPGFNLPFLIRRDLWDMIGGYDMNYDPWGSNSDSDLEYKIKLAGVQSLQDTGTLVYHFSQTSGTFNPENNSYWAKNFAYFEEKWGFPRTDNGIWEATFTIPDEGRKFRPEWEGKYEPRRT